MEIIKRFIDRNYTAENNRQIKALVVHHTASVNNTNKQLYDLFNNPAHKASTHYGIDKNHELSQFVRDHDIAWSIGNSSVSSIGNFNTISIEVTDADSNWNIDPKNIDVLVEFLYNKAKEYNLLPLQLNKNIFGHRDLAPTICPGASLYNQLPIIVDKVNNFKKKR